MMTEQWGPWIVHDGKGCPCVGMYVEVAAVCIVRGILPIWGGIAGSEGGESWNWDNHPEFSKVTDYRIRKPKGMTILEQLVKNPERELEDV